MSVSWMWAMYAVGYVVSWVAIVYAVVRSSAIAPIDYGKDGRLDWNVALSLAAIAAMLAVVWPILLVVTAAVLGAGWFIRRIA